VVPVADELSLLRQAQAALNTNPARALSLVSDHQRAYPAAHLAQEREVIAIAALAKLGRVPEARTRAAEFFARFPGSAHRQRVEALVR
jgi:hypothetical protein